MTTLNAAYAAALRMYLADPGEATLRAAYELGRDAVRRQQSLLDLSIAHHDALADILESGAHQEGPAAVRAAGEFLLESMSAFEMVQRGFREVHDAAQLERRHADMLRQLSHFLSDSSLALEAPDALAEVRHLVAEQAREFVGAEGCLVVTRAADGRAAWSASHPSGDVGWQAFVRWTDLSEVDEAVREAGGPLRLPGPQAAALLAPSGTRGLEVRGWLGAPLIALGGRHLGAIHLVNRLDGSFTALDEAVAVHMAQMAAATVERAQLYAGTA
jgi:GAF domain-containing protein